MEKQNLPYTISGKTLVYQMPRELDDHVAKQLCNELDRLVETYSVMELVLDFTQTEFMDSSGIGVVIGRSKTMHFREGTLSAANLGERVSAIFHAAGLSKIVQIKEI